MEYEVGAQLVDEPTHILVDSLIAACRLTNGLEFVSMEARLTLIALLADASVTDCLKESA